jgi:hypothetical protein
LWAEWFIPLKLQSTEERKQFDLPRWADPARKCREEWGMQSSL